MRRFILRLLSVFRRDEADHDLDREVASHLALLEDEYRRRGLTPEDARFASRRAIGSVAQAKDLHRDARSFAWLDDLRRDVRHAIRQLQRAPGFALAATLTLGLGIGVNNTFFTIVNAICLRGLPIEEPERVLSLGTRDARDRPGNLSYAEFEAIRSMGGSLAGVGAFMSAPVTIGDEGRAPDRFLGSHISAAGLDVLGELPMLGRAFQAEDDRAGAPPVVVLGAAVWRARYAADPGLIGRTILVNGTPANVIGVMRDGFRFPINTDVWQPLGAMPGVTGQRRDARLVSVIARLAPGASIESARAEVDGIGAVWRREFPETNRGIRATAVPVNEQFSGNVTDRTWLSFITAGVLVLLVACANVANLLLMRGAARGREIAIRAAMGAGRARLVRQLLIESAVLSLLGAVAGVILSLAGLRLLSAMVPADTLFYWMTFTMDGRVLTVLVLASVASVFVFGLAPALHLLRVDVNQTIKESGRIGTVGVPARRWTASFLAVEFGLTLVLLALVFAGLRRGLADDRAEFPLDPAPVLSMWITLPGQLYESPESRVAFYDRLVERFAAIPGVSSVAVSSVMPRVSAPAMQIEIAGRPQSENDAAPMVALVGAGDSYFDTLGMPLVRGRSFGPRDGMPGQESAIVNQRFVDMFFGTSDPIGALIRVARPGTTVSGPWSRIIGVAPTIRQRPSGLYPDPVVYLPHRANPSSTAAVLVHAASEPATLAPAVRAALHRLDPNLPVYRLMTLDRAIDEAQWNGRMAGVMAQGIGLIALLMALVGLYAVTAHAVHFLRPELGLRIALGAQPRGVAAIVVKRAIRHLGLGLLVGLMCTYAFDRLFTAADDPSKLTDVRVLVPLVGLMAIVGLAACAIPVRRAIRVDPVVALRAE